MWNKLRWQGKHAQASSLKGTRWALLKNIQDLTGEQKTTMASIAVTNKGLYRAYLLKEQLRYVFEAKGERGRQLLAGWLAWAKRSRLPEFTKLAKTIEKYKPLILNTLDHELSNAPRRSHEHPPTCTDPALLRLPLTRIPYRHGPPHPRRALAPSCRAAQRDQFGARQRQE